MADITSTVSAWTVFYALAGGILPAIAWVWFWLQEDKLNPEPRMRITFSFLGGMLAVALVYPLQRIVFEYFGGINTQTLFSWAVIEEVMKYVVVAVIVLHSRDFDEPLDAMEYLIITALGFAALENALYILNPLLAGLSLQGLMNGNERFIGATLVHVVSSAILGYCLARGFYLTRVGRMGWRVLGLSLAIALHTLFNLFIIGEKGNGRLLVFSMVWMMVIVILLLFEKIKKIKAKS